MGRLLTAQEVADLTTLSPQTLYAWRSKGRDDVPCGFKLAGRVVWDEDDVLAWIASEREASTTPGDAQ